MGCVGIAHTPFVPARPKNFTPPQEVETGESTIIALLFLSSSYTQEPRRETRGWSDTLTAAEEVKKVQQEPDGWAKLCIRVWNKSVEREYREKESERERWSQAPLPWKHESCHSQQLHQVELQRNNQAICAAMLTTPHTSSHRKSPNASMTPTPFNDNDLVQARYSFQI